MKHYGDITQIKGNEVELVDIVTGGSPCQDLSVAGKRAGMKKKCTKCDYETDGNAEEKICPVCGAELEFTRSGLFMEQIRIIKEMRDESIRRLQSRGATIDIRCVQPRYMVWENVQGAFSSNNGEDFRAVLEETAKVAKGDARIPRFEGKWPHSGCIMGDGWSIAWRLHDAQFWGVPQRRKRIALVADFGGETAGEILFERKSVSGNPQESGKPGQGIAATVEGCTDEPGKCLNSWDVQSKHIQPVDGVAEAIYSGECRGGGGEQYVLQEPSAYTLKIRGGVETDSNGRKAGKGALVQTELSGTLGVSQDQTLIQTKEVFDASRRHNYEPLGEVCETVQAHYGTGGGNVPMVLENNPIGFDGYNQAVTGDVAKSLSNKATDSDHVPIVIEGNGARPSHTGDGYSESETMYTLNATEKHAVAYRKKGHPQNAKQGQGWEHTNISDTLNTNDSTDGHTPIAIVQQKHSVCIGNGQADISSHITDEVSQTINCMHDQLAVYTEQKSYQKTTGALQASGYSKLGTQEALNDMYVTQSLETFHCVSEDEKVQTLKARDYKDPHCVCYGLDRASFNQGANAQYDFRVEEEKIGTQVAKGPGAICQSVVRRLTPMECERLQGYPDNWTNIGDWIDSKGKKHKGDSDSPRYKALGNSIALPFWQWMARKMVNYIDKPTMASLFDGIGGFPLVFSRCGCKPIWASEIEEFPIAVTKIRFPESEDEA